MSIILNTILIATVTVTSYQSKVQDTDSTPYRTSINERVNNLGVAVHPSLLCPKAKVVTGRNRFRVCKRNEKGCVKDKLHYYDTVFIERIGFKQVFDVMAEKTKMGSKFDVWLSSEKEEQQFHRKYGCKKLKAYLVKEKHK
jgi:3D (Asp-Asp-Asp) domain-containing protein